jgi:hypothetical protein
MYEPEVTDGQQFTTLGLHLQAIYFLSFVDEMMGSSAWRRFVCTAENAKIEISRPHRVYLGQRIHCNGSVLLDKREGLLERQQSSGGCARGHPWLQTTAVAEPGRRKYTDCGGALRRFRVEEAFDEKPAVCGKVRRTREDQICGGNTAVRLLNVVIIKGRDSDDDFIQQTAETPQVAPFIIRVCGGR